MRAVAVLMVVGALAAGVASLAGSAAASHRAAETSAQNAAYPSWSPDGKQIAFVYPSSKRYRIVRTSSKPGGAIHTVLAASGGCCRELQWAADGRILVNPNSRLKSLIVKDGKPKRLFFSSCPNSYGCQTVGFILSPNREYAAAAITSDDGDPHDFPGIGLVKLRRGREPAVLESPLAEESATALTFSPDGAQLVFRLSTWDGVSDPAPPSVLMALRLGGGDPVPLAQSGIPGASLVPSDVQQVQWSPDGRWVAYVEYDNEGSENLEVVPTAGASAPRSLATCGDDDYDLFRFSWSPTSKLIAYDCNRFMTVRPDGTHVTDLLKGRHLAYSQYAFAAGPQWSPDGSRLLFVATRIFLGAPGSVDHVYTVRADGRNLTRRS
jgi:Tol biopolymer transport system component